MEFSAYKMRYVCLFAVIALVIGVAQSRPAQLNSLILLEKVGLKSERAGANDAFPKIIAGSKSGTGETSGVKNGQNKNVGFILFGNIEDLNKYHIEFNDNTENKRLNSDFILNSVYNDKETLKDLLIKLDIPQEILKNYVYKMEDEAQEKGREEQEKNKLFLDDYEEDEDSEYYHSFDEERRKDSTNVDIFSEDEYNDYDDKENGEEDVSREKEEKDEERFYSEEEKYYEDEAD